MTDDRRLYPAVLDPHGCAANQAVISQGGVVYDAPLRRYLFVSWSCSTHQLYEAPEPWVPWRLFLSKDFGRKSTAENRGQYGTNIPSKFISNDGKTLWLQSNVCCGGNSYTYALRKIYLEPASRGKPSNPPSNENLAVTDESARAIAKSTRRGSLCGVNCFDVTSSGNANASEDDDDGEQKQADWWGYIWAQNHNLNELVYETGDVSSAGGWFSGNLRVQVRQDGRWIDVTGLSVSPPYVFDRSLPSHRLTTFRFSPTWGSGVRVIGTPGGDGHFTSVGQLAVYCNHLNLVDDDGFEYQVSPKISGSWRGEGPGEKGITRFEQRGHSGANDAWLENMASEWNAVVQTVTVQPHTRYRLSAWVRSNFTAPAGRVGIRRQGQTSEPVETAFGAAHRFTKVTADFDSGNDFSVDVYIGFRGTSVRQLLEIDDVSLEPR